MNNSVTSYTPPSSTYPHTVGSLLSREESRGITAVVKKVASYIFYHIICAICSPRRNELYNQRKQLYDAYKDLFANLETMSGLQAARKFYERCQGEYSTFFTQQEKEGMERALTSKEEELKRRRKNFRLDQKSKAPILRLPKVKKEAGPNLSNSANSSALGPIQNEPSKVPSTLPQPVSCDSPVRSAFDTWVSAGCRTPKKFKKYESGSSISRPGHSLSLEPSSQLTSTVKQEKISVSVGDSGKSESGVARIASVVGLTGSPSLVPNPPSETSLASSLSSSSSPSLIMLPEPPSASGIERLSSASDTVSDTVSGHVSISSVSAFVERSFSMVVRGVMGFSNAVGEFFFESNNVENYGWKIKRYHAQIERFNGFYRDYLVAHDLFERMQAPEPLIGMEELQQLAKSLAAFDTAYQEEYSQEYLSKLRDLYYNKIIGIIRNAANWSDANKSHVNASHINAISNFLITSMDLNKGIKEIYQKLMSLAQKSIKENLSEDLTLSQYIEECEKASLNKHNIQLPSSSNDPTSHLIKTLLESYITLCSVPKKAKGATVSKLYNSLIGYFNGFLGLIEFDPTGTSNPAHLLYKCKISLPDKTSKTVSDLALGTPTIQNGYYGNTDITPEFIAHLRHCKATGKKHLYINYQNFLDPHEVARCTALHALAESEEFKGVFIIYTMNQNSRFFNQDRPGDEQALLANKFMNELYQDYFEGSAETTGNSIPEDMRKHFDLEKWSRGTIEEIHSKIYQGKKSLTKEERLEFICYFQELLSLKIRLCELPDFANGSCKDCIDRGPKREAGTLMSLGILNNLLEERWFIDFFVQRVLARSFIVRKREMIEEHFFRMYRSMLSMVNHREQVVEMYQVLFPGVKFEFQLPDSNEFSQIEELTEPHPFQIV